MRKSSRSGGAWLSVGHGRDRGSVDQTHHHARRVELPALLAGVVRELLDQVLVGAPQHVGLAQVVVAQVDLGEVLPA